MPEISRAYSHVASKNLIAVYSCTFLCAKEIGKVVNDMYEKEQNIWNQIVAHILYTRQIT